MKQLDINLLKQYSADQLLRAFFEKEAEFRINEFFNKTIESEGTEKFNNMIEEIADTFIDNSERILNSDNMDELIMNIIN